jgi:hypothetical protein
VTLNTGDGIVAVFEHNLDGYEHVQRACDAALATRDALNARAQALLQERELELSVRIGLNTGEVLTGAIGGAHTCYHTVTGYAVSLAKRIEGLAMLGRVYVSEHTAARSAAQSYTTLEPSPSREPGRESACSSSSDTAQAINRVNRSVRQPPAGVLAVTDPSRGPGSRNYEPVALKPHVDNKQGHATRTGRKTDAGLPAQAARSAGTSSRNPPIKTRPTGQTRQQHR